MFLLVVYIFGWQLQMGLIPCNYASMLLTKILKTKTKSMQMKNVKENKIKIRLKY